ncbi:MAG: hypothetical protein RLY74_537 [Actinomycetota bacterium]|jgi:hypothetical protein
MNLEIVIAVGILLLIWYLTFSANRLDRLHHRVETSWANLDAILQRRAAIAQEIAHLPEIDPASNLILMSAAHQAREAEIFERSEAESGLSGALRLLRDESDVPHLHRELFLELDQVTDRLRTAIAIHQEAVVSTINRRSKFIIRFFRLAGRAPLPVTYPFEDEIL